MCVCEAWIFLNVDGRLMMYYTDQNKQFTTSYLTNPSLEDEIANNT